MDELRNTQFSYTGNYAHPELHGEKSINDHMTDILLGVIPPNGNLLDVGCGAANKIIPIAAAGITVIGIDVSTGLLSEAQQNIQESGLENITIKQGNTDQLPIEDGSVDCVSYMLAPHNTVEAYRVLKPGGYAIRERVGFGDKDNIKRPFQNVDGSPRGYQGEIPSEEALKIMLTEDFARAGFIDIKFEVIEIETFYTPDGLRKLLKETPTVKDYDEVKDKSIVDELINSQMNSEGKIRTIQRRLILIARKPEQSEQIE